MKKIIMITLLLMVSCKNQKPTEQQHNHISKYKITQPTNGKFNAIIKLEKQGKDAYNCSAFVISDTTAITAGHCIETTSQYIDDIPKYIEESKSNIISLQKRIDILKQECLFPIACQTTIKVLEVKINEELRIQENFSKLKADQFKVFDINGNDTKIKATSFFKYGERRDYGSVTGNFTKFNKLKVKHNTNLKRGDILRACGFPGGKVPAICEDFEFVGTSHFLLKGNSLFVPGISGGPIIDYNGEVVGVAVAAGENFSYAETSLGMLDGE